ncbi:MAG: nicotinate-nucleotide adenylyltransferase [Rhodothermales bacterium]|nr:nicotinate-nucleotide adenylyltransferase [Rhodothermales bacterium]
MRVGILGGTFNPPHIAHLILAETIRVSCALDQIRWIPAGTPPHKSADTAAEHRLAMTRIAVAGNPAFTVSDLEVVRGGASYTIDTVELLQRTEPDVDFSLLIGSDSLADLLSWRRPDDLVARLPLIVYPRPGADPRPEAATRYARRITFVDAPLIEVSSYSIRRRVHQGLSIRYLVPEAVYAYIAEHGLYR